MWTSSSISQWLTTSSISICSTDTKLNTKWSGLAQNGTHLRFEQIRCFSVHFGTLYWKSGVFKSQVLLGANLVCFRPGLTSVRCCAAKAAYHICISSGPIWIQKRSITSAYHTVVYRDGRFGSKVGQIGPKWDKSGAFSDQISVHLAREPNPPSLLVSDFDRSY